MEDTQPMRNLFTYTLTIAVTILTISAINAAAATFIVSNTNDSGAGSLRQAVLDANAAATADTIVFDASFNVPKMITVATVINISPAAGVDTLTITGPGANLLTITNNNNRIFQNGANDPTQDLLTISGINFVQSAIATQGPINNFANLTVNNCVFSGNNATTASGRAIANAIATSVLTVSNSAFNGGSSGFGGAISSDGTATITNSTFSSNTAGSGGAISSGGVLNVTGCTFTNNVSTNGSATGLGGGAIYSSSNLITATATITDSTFTGNTVGGSQGGGGAIRNRSGSMTITNSNFTGNSAVPGGGAVHNTDVISISGCNFTNNSAVGGGSVQVGTGGAISNQGGGQVTIANSVITGNSAASHGGGIYFQPNADGALMNVSNSTISNNTSNSDSNTTGDGGGMYTTNGGGTVLVNISGSTISGNTAISGGTTNGNGGGVYAVQQITLENTTISGNVAELDGGGIFDTFPGSINSRVVLNGSTVVNNRATRNGGGIRSSNSVGDTPTSLYNTIVANNTASGGTAQDVLNPIVSQGYNLIKNTTGTTITGTTTGNITGVDPLLGPLSFNGGATRTHGLLSGSPAIDTGDPTVFSATDQRGISRPQDGDGTGGARSDIGAYERRLNDVLAHQFADFDGDGKTDISIFRPAPGEWWYLRSLDGGNRAAQFGQSTDKIVAADYTGDGKADVAFFRPSTGEWFILRSEDGSFYSFPFGISGDVPTPADFDGDGKADPAVFRPSNQTWYISRSSGGTTITTFGIAGDLPVAADYDGDGKADIGIYRPSNGQWWLSRSQAGLTVNTFGISTDKTVQADYTGDGKADVAIFRPSTREWFVLRSEDNSYYSALFGAAGDIAAPGDYDGDGKSDFAIVRPSTNTWYLQRSTSGFTAITFGITNDIPIPNAFVR